MRDAVAVDRVVRRLAAVVALTGLGYLGLVLAAGWGDVAQALRSIGPVALAAGLALTSGHIAVRWARWELMLGTLGLRVPRRESARIYVAGLALGPTPGKLGETFRSVLLLRWGVPPSASLIAFLVDRLSDLVGVLLLAALSGRQALWWALAAAAMSGGFVLRHGDRLARALSRVRAGRWARSMGEALQAGGAHLRSLWRLPQVALYAGMALFAYGLQAASFVWIVHALWPTADSWQLVHAFATATLAGAASMIPGGLGAMELVLVAQLVADGMPSGPATAAALATRLVTLWFAIALGVGCLTAEGAGPRR